MPSTAAVASGFLKVEVAEPVIRTVRLAVSPIAGPTLYWLGWTPPIILESPLPSLTTPKILYACGFPLGSSTLALYGLSAPIVLPKWFNMLVKTLASSELPPPRTG